MPAELHAMSGTLNPSNGVNRFHGASATASFPTPDCGSTASFLELTNSAAAAAAAAAAADFAYDLASLGGLRAPPASHAAAGGFGVSYFAAAECAENYAASLAWESQSATFASAHYHAQSPFTPVSCDLGPFGLANPSCPVSASSAARIQAMAVQRFGAQVSRQGSGGPVPGAGGGSGPHHPSQKTKTRRRVATVAQRRAANIRERRRMFNLNAAFDKLRKKVPTFAYEKRLSRIETLRLAIMYIAFMTEVIRGKETDAHRLHEHHRLALPPLSYHPPTNALGDAAHLWNGPAPIAADSPVNAADPLTHVCSSRQV